VLSDATIVNPTFEADILGTYTLQLIVNDSQVDSVADTVTITVNDGSNSSPVPTCIDPTTLTPEFD
jgi:PKD repeat protein